MRVEWWRFCGISVPFTFSLINSYVSLYFIERNCVKSSHQSQKSIKKSKICRQIESIGCVFQSLFTFRGENPQNPPLSHATECDGKLFLSNSTSFICMKRTEKIFSYRWMKIMKFSLKYEFIDVRIHKLSCQTNFLFHSERIVEIKN